MALKKTLGIGLAALLTLALLVGLGMGVGSLVAAQPAASPAAEGPVGEEHPPTDATSGAPVVVAEGKITELTADGFKMDAPRGAITVLVNAQTWIVVGGAPPVEGNTASLKVNMGVHVEGTSPADGQIAARVVREQGVRPDRPNAPDAPGQPSQPDRPAPVRGQVHGTISEATATNVSLVLEGGRTVQFQVSDATIVVKGGFVALTDLHRGDVVEVIPQLLPQRGMSAPPGPRAAQAGPGDGQVPDNVQPGQPAPSGIPTAGLIWVPQNDRMVRGRVEKLDGATALVNTPGGLLTVQLGDTTAYKRVTAPNVAPTAATQSDVAVNAPVVVFGSAVAGQERTFAASSLVLLPVPAVGGPAGLAPPSEQKQP